MTITLEKNDTIDAIVDALLAIHPMSSIVYEVVDNQLVYEVVPHEVFA